MILFDLFQLMCVIVLICFCGLCFLGGWYYISLALDAVSEWLHRRNVKHNARVRASLPAWPPPPEIHCDVAAFDAACEQIEAQGERPDRRIAS